MGKRNRISVGPRSITFSLSFVFTKYLSLGDRPVNFPVLTIIGKIDILFIVFFLITI